MKRKVLAFSLLCFFSALSLLQRVFPEHASLPPRGWNSYDSFIWVISEQEFLENAELVAQKLKSHGYEYVVVDYLWYRRKVEGANTNSLGFDVIDGWGRMVPDPGRWPSSKGGKGFSEVAKKVHDLGLKFGIHVMKGISTQAVNANTPILDITKGTIYEESGRKWYASDIGIRGSPCGWMNNGFMSVNTELGAGKAFLRSLYQQYADWGIDFVKHDCVFGKDDFDLREITYVSEVLRGLQRPIIYSLSPGVKTTPTMAKSVLGLVNMYRITADDWDSWNDVAGHFDVSRDFAAANMIGAQGLQGKSWPDLDMLPLGWLSSPDTNNGPFRPSNLTPDGQKTQMTLWAMAKSPIMFGGDMRKLDEATYNVITNPTILEIDSFSANNQEFPYIGATNARWFRRPGLTPLSISFSGAYTKETDVFGLTNCTDPRAKGWSSIGLAGDNRAQICWNGSTRRNVAPLCLYKRQPILSLDRELIHKQHQQHRGKFHLTATDGAKFCLDASPKRKLASQVSKSGSFSPCKSVANQMWELSYDGTLKNSHSGLCASVNQVDGVPKGVRAWIATGRKGEIYLAFFNLNQHKTLISANIPDLAKALRREKVPAACNCREVWSGRDLGPVKESVSMEVEIHGCALFVLNCNS